MKEPIAAAIGYGVDKINDDVERTVLVYDLGATSLGVTVLWVEQGVFEVAGHERVEGWWGAEGFEGTGGRKVDENVAGWIMREVASRINNGESHDDEKGSQLQGNPSMMLDPELVRKIREEVAEGVKIALSEQEAVEIDVGELLTNDMNGMESKLTMTRKDFEDVNHIWFEDTLPTIQRVLSAANVSWDKVDAVLVVGGSGKIPMVRRAVERYLRRERNSIMEGTVDPAEAVFTGAIAHAMVSEDWDVKTWACWTDGFLADFTRA